MEKFLKLIIKEAGFLAKGYYHAGVESKEKCGPTDIVTVADKETSDFLIKKIREDYPDHGIISEEVDTEINPNAEYTWVIDPIDGTRNFANRIAFWCTMIGITKNGQPYMGAIYDAMNDELFFAEVGKGAFVNDQPIKVSKVEDPYTCFINFSVGRFGNDSPYDTEYFSEYFKFYTNLCRPHGMWAMNFGSGLTGCHVAAGRIDAHVLNGLLYHDILAQFIIATEAGAKFTNCHGEIWKRGDKDIVVANPKLHVKLMKMFE
ncbi:MAG: inositol monophosphatase [Candidatus Magasanikbacteria bacterium]